MRKLKGAQPNKTPAVQLAHLGEEGPDDEEGTDCKDPDGLDGVIEGIHGAPCQSHETCSARQEVLLLLQQPRPFHQGLPVGEISQKRTKFKLQRGGIAKEGSPDPSRRNDDSAEGAPGWNTQGVGCHTQTVFLNPDSFQ